LDHLSKTTAARKEQEETSGSSQGIGFFTNSMKHQHVANTCQHQRGHYHVVDKVVCVAFLPQWRLIISFVLF
jgi:hypothetical protein